MIQFVSKFSFLFVIFLAAWSSTAIAQNACFTENEAAQIIRTIKNPSKVKKDKQLKRELLRMQEKRESLNREAFEDIKNAELIVARSNQENRKNLIRVCGILKETGWLRKEIVGDDGVDAMLFIIRNSDELEIQEQLFPVLAEAAKAGFISKANLAPPLDKKRIAERGKQIFGTQIRVRDEIGYLYPLENKANVDRWRKSYDLPRLAEFIKLIEMDYRTIVVSMPLPPQLTSKKSVLPISKTNDAANLGLTENDDEILSIESGLVNLNLRVLNKDLLGTRGLDLKKEDFLVYENGELQNIGFFSTTDTPFDLVLLLDLSGSTREKQYLIAESAASFIQLARPGDRIAIVAFTDRISIVSEFSSDKQKLYEKVRKIDDYGTSRVWDALEFTYEKLLSKQDPGRRSAVVFMTDGVDNSLMQNRARQRAGSYFYSSRPSQITFTDLLETVRKNETTLFSIYLDTENGYSGTYASPKSYRQARRGLEFLAEESGGQFYRAAQLEDLNGIYERIINDLSEVYSVGYESKNEDRDGSWRAVNVKVKGRADLTVKSKSGYYAR